MTADGSGARSGVSIVVGRVRDAVSQGPMLQNLGAAFAIQLALLISGTVSARILGPTNRGYLAVLAILPSTVGQLGAVGISLAATYYIAAGRIGGRELIALLRRPVTVQVIGLTSVAAGLLGAYLLLSKAPIAVAACMSIVYLPAILALDYGVALALGARRHDLANVFRLMGPTVGAAGLVALYVAGGGALDEVTAVIVVSAVLAGVAAFTVGLRAVMEVRPPTSPLQMPARGAARREILRFGRKGYVGYLSPMDSLRIDQLIVLLLLSPRDLGIYVVGAAFTTLPRLVAVNIGLSGTPEVARRKQADERQLVIHKTLIMGTVVLVGITALTCAGLVVAIPVLFGPAFAPSVVISELLLVASCLLSIKRVAVDLVRGAGEARIGTGAEIVTVAVFVVLCVPAGVALGGAGVAGSVVVASVSGSIYLARRMRRLGFMPWGYDGIDTLRA